VVVDVVGGAGLGRSIAASRVGGLVVLDGFLDGTASALDLPLAIRRSVSLRASSGRSRESFEALVRAVSSSGLRPAIDRVFPFERAADAFACMASGGQFGKIVMRFGQE
jgi:NADPH:quinone reductase-like Zn-dependent oxidoreductase